MARLSDLDYERQREEVAKNLGIRMSVLDEQRKRAQQAGRGDQDDDTARAKLVAIALKNADCFKDDGGDGYAAVQLSTGSSRTFKLESDAFRDWLRSAYGEAYPTKIDGYEIPGSVSESTFQDALRTIVAYARQQDTRQVFLRLGWARGADAPAGAAANTLYLDAGTDDPRAIEITASGWAVIVNPPVHLIFSQTARPLPTPKPASRKVVLRELCRFLGLRATDDRFVLLLGFLMALLMPRGPYPVLIVSGEQGSAKTTRARMLKTAVDPTKAPVRGKPRSAEDLAISVWRSWVPNFDNLSKLDQDMSDWLCRLSEGAGLPKRKLYSDSEEVLIEAARPIILTSIPDLARSGDLIDRSVLIRTDPLPHKIREQVLLDQFDAFRPRLLAYLIEAASCALRRFPEMSAEHDGLRRGDWAAWVEAAAPALGLRPGRFLEAYKRNQDNAVRQAAELDAVGAAILEHMTTREVVGPMAVSALHAELEPVVRKIFTGRVPLDWPSMSHHFSGRLLRLAPMLRRLGIEVEHSGHTRAGSQVRLTRFDIPSRNGSGEACSGASQASQASQGGRRGKTEERDAGDAGDASKQTTADAGKKHTPGNGAACCVCGEALGNGRMTVKTAAGQAHHDCVAEAEPEPEPAPKPKRRFKRGDRPDA